MQLVIFTSLFLLPSQGWRTNNEKRHLRLQSLRLFWRNRSGCMFGRLKWFFFGYLSRSTSACAPPNLPSRSSVHMMQDWVIRRMLQFWGAFCLYFGRGSESGGGKESDRPWIVQRPHIKGSHSSMHSVTVLQSHL